MLAQGAPLHVVSEVLGHVSIAITIDMYGRCWRQQQQAARSMSGQVVFRGGGWLAVAPSMAPKQRQSPLPGGNGPLTWARSKGFEPPTF